MSMAWRSHGDALLSCPETSPDSDWLSTTLLVRTFARHVVLQAVLEKKRRSRNKPRTFAAINARGVRRNGRLAAATKPN